MASPGDIKDALDRANPMWKNVELRDLKARDYPPTKTFCSLTSMRVPLPDFRNPQEVNLLASYLLAVGREWAENGAGLWVPAKTLPEGSPVGALGAGDRVFTLHAVPGTGDYALVAGGCARRLVRGTDIVRDWRGHEAL